jgi:hypothetical protein
VISDRVSCFHSSVAISRHPSTSIHDHVDHVEHASSSSPSGHSKKHPHRYGWLGSQPIRENPRRPEATRGNGTQRDSRSPAARPHRQPHRSAPPRDRETSTSALCATSSSRDVAPGQRVIDALGTISSAPMTHEPSIADEIRGRRPGRGIAGAIAQTGLACAAFSQHDRRSSEPAARE